MAGRGSISFILLNFRSRRWWLTVDAEIPRSAAIRFPVHRWSRRAAIRHKDVLRDTAVQPVGAGGPVLKAISPLGPETCDPLTGSRLGDSEGGGSISHGRPFLEHAAHQLFSTIRRQSGILVGVHSALLLGVGFFWKCQHSRSGPNGQQPGCSSQLELRIDVFSGDDSLLAQEVVYWEPALETLVSSSKMQHTQAKQTRTCALSAVPCQCTFSVLL